MDEEEFFAAIEMELESGDFITLSREIIPEMVQEEILTFSGMHFFMEIPYADYAKTKFKSKKISQESPQSREAGIEIRETSDEIGQKNGESNEKRDE